MDYVFCLVVSFTSRDMHSDHLENICISCLDNLNIRTLLANCGGSNNCLIVQIGTSFLFINIEERSIFSPAKLRFF